MSRLLLFGFLLGCGAGAPPEARMAPCPPSPNCVTSLDPADPDHAVEPLPWVGDSPEEALQHAVDAAMALRRTAIVEQTDRYAHLVAVTRLLRFKDDVELQVDEDRRVVHIRSASRIGRSDLGVNRRRVESIREQMGQTVEMSAR